ncbi:MAG: dihydrolipoamide acetyltransferase [Myxococcota bacterium]
MRIDRLLRNALLSMPGVALLAVSAISYAQDESRSATAVEDASTPTSRDDGEASDFNQELLSIEEEVSSLKEQVFRSKATLQLLKEIVVQGSSQGSSATIWHVNKLGSGYTLESVAYFLDGRGQFAKSDPTGVLDEQREFKVFDAALPPGNHNLTVNMKLRGNGFGVFSYVKNYTFNVQSSYVFSAEEGKACQVRVIANERKGIGRSFTERPNVNFETRCLKTNENE